jgi:hypothetical protein
MERITRLPTKKHAAKKIPTVKEPMSAATLASLVLRAKACEYGSATEHDVPRTEIISELETAAFEFVIACVSESGSSINACSNQLGDADPPSITVQLRTLMGRRGL